MPEHGAARDEVQAVAEVSDLLRRAGVRATKEQVQRLVEPHQMLQQGLQALRQRLAAGIEPVNVFDSAEATRPLGGPDGY